MATRRGCPRDARKREPSGGYPVQPTASGAQIAKRRGQALTEMGLVVALCVVLSLGIVEFGYMFMALNLITQATAAGARAASVLQIGSRGLCGKITDDSAITSSTGIVRTQIASVAISPNVVVAQDPLPNGDPAVPCQTFGGSTIPKVIVTTTGTLPDIFHLFGSPISFTRIAQFRDEGR